MPKTKVDPFLLAKKYLKKIGVDDSVISKSILPAKYKPIVYCVSQKKSNVTAQKKSHFLAIKPTLLYSIRVIPCFSLPPK